MDNLYRLQKSSRRAFTLVEVLFTIAIATVAVLGIISALMFSIYIQADLRQRNLAYREATAILESTKKDLFTNLNEIDRDVIIDTGGNMDPDDDLMGTVELEFFDMDGDPIVPAAAGTELIRARVTVTWTPPGRGDTDQFVVVESLLAPP